jgi:glycosyltransferase involved in cell wall biosynthesis
VSQPARFAVAQLGARMHYAVPRILHSAGRLAHLYTDMCAVRGFGSVLRALPMIAPSAQRKAAGRMPLGIPVEKISTFDALALAYAARVRMARTRAAQARAHVWANESFCANVLKRGLPKDCGVYTFNGAGLALLKDRRDRGMPAVMEQTIAPLRLERELIREERERHPAWEDWEEHDGGAVDELCRREEDEWRVAERIVWGSAFVRDGIEHQHGPSDKCVIGPYWVDPSVLSCARPPRSKGEALRVLTVGALSLRKGLPYVLKAAQLAGGAFRFRAVGGAAVSKAALEAAARHVEIVGSIPRADMRAQYEWADVFLLPSLYEGSAAATYEALAAGLPVICTPNTGSIVRHGVDGFIVPIRDADSIVEKLRLLHEDRGLLGQMSEQACATASANSAAAYSSRLIAAIAARGSE